MDVCDPVAQRLVHGVLQRRGAAGDGTDLRAQQIHPQHVRRLPLDIDGAHVDDAGQAEEGAHGRGGHAMLSGAGFGDDARLAHPAGEQDLAHAVVDLVRAGVIELLALKIDSCAPEVFGQAPREIKRTGPADVGGEVAVQLGLERVIGLGCFVGALESEHQGHQRLGHVAPAEIAEAAIGVRLGGIIVGTNVEGHGTVH